MAAATALVTPERSEIDPAHTWDLSAIFPSWEAWDEAVADLERRIGEFKAFAGTLGTSGARLRAALEAHDAIGQLSYRVWYYPSLTHDQDQRDNASAARRQRVQLLFARLEHATSWFNPELLTVPLETIHAWMDGRPGAGRLPLRRRGPVPQAGARARPAGRAAAVALVAAGAARRKDVYEALSTADAKFPDRHALSTGDERRVHLRQLPPHPRHQPRRGRPPRGLRRALRRVRRHPQHLRVDLQRRAAPRLVPGAGARLRDARSRRRSSATPFRPMS